MARRHRSKAAAMPRDEAADRERARDLLARLADLLHRIGHPRAAEVDLLRAAFGTEAPAAWRTLDGNAWWAGAGSLAAESLVEPEHLPQTERLATRREFRAVLIELAELLRARGPTNPGLSSWLLAFRNWEASEV